MYVVKGMQFFFVYYTCEIPDRRLEIKIIETMQNLQNEKIDVNFLIIFGICKLSLFNYSFLRMYEQKSDLLIYRKLLPPASIWTFNDGN
jgi:hypothetical protein